MPLAGQCAWLALAATPLALGQFQTFNPSTYGISGPPSPTLSVSRSLTTSASSTTTEDVSNMLLTTVFTQPAECSDGLTSVAGWSDVLWRNMIQPLETVTMSSCFPSQFSYSIMATASLPPFSQLVCPKDWASWDVNQTYIICCPHGFAVRAPNFNKGARPGLHAFCTSWIMPEILMDITSYDATALKTVIPGAKSTDGVVVLAHAFDGFKPDSTQSTGPLSQADPSHLLTGSSSVLSTTKPTFPQTTAERSTTPTTTDSATASTSATVTPYPDCGMTCLNNMLGQYAALGCETSDPACLCRNPNFLYGIRDCSNAVCDPASAIVVLDTWTNLCAEAILVHTTYPTTAPAGPTSISDLPSCGQTCFHNMQAQHSDLGCASAEPACLCRNINFYYGIRDCSNGACGRSVASTVIAFESAYCASATAALHSRP